MSKQITPKELLEIIGGLLLEPRLLCASVTSTVHQQFMRDIGEVISAHFGGVVHQINPPETLKNYLGCDESTPTLSVQPDSGWNDWAEVVWRYHDVHGWAEDSPTLKGVVPTPDMSALIRSDLHDIISGNLVPFSLLDSAGGGGVIKGEMINDEIGLSFQFDGYSDSSHEMNKGYPVVIENYGKVLYLRVFADINSEEPTHSIPLDGARNERRMDE